MLSIIRSLALALALTTPALLAGCGGGDGPTNPGGGGGGATPSISITLSAGSINVTAGQSGTVTVNVTRAGGFNGAVTVAADAVTGVTVQPLTIAAGATSGTLTFQVAGTVAAGTLQTTVRASGQGVTQATATLSLVVAAAPVQDFTLAVNPAAVTLQQGQNATVQVQVTRTGGFTGAVTLAASGLPNGVTAAFDPPAPTANTSTLTLTAAAGAALGNVNVTVSGTAQGVTGTKTATVALTVNAALPAGDYALSLNPTSIQLQQGGSASTAVGINRTGGFTGEVTLSATGLPQGVTASFDPATTTGNTSTLTLSAAAGATTGTVTVSVAGSATGLAGKTVNLGVTVAQSGGGGSGNVSWAFCDITGIPIWFAYQDGNGPWTRVVGDAQNLYRFQIDSQRGAVAWVSIDEGAPLTQVFYYTRDEFLQVGASQCDGEGGFKTVNGSLAGLGPMDVGFVALGSSDATVNIGESPNFVLNNVQDSPQDLIATRAAVSFAPLGLVPDRMIIRRNLNPANNSTLPVLNFATEGFAPVSATMTVNGLLAGEQATVVGLFTTARKGLGAYFVTLAPGGSTQPYYGVPENQLVAGDLHYTQVVGFDASGAGPTPPPTRQVAVAYRQVQDRTVTLGPVLVDPAISVVGTAPYARLRAQWTLQAQYNRFVYVVFSQPNVVTENVRSFQLGATDGYLAGAASVDFTMPDLSGVSGWNNAWGLAAGANTIWTTTGTGWQGPGIINFPDLTDGTQLLSATRSGQVTP